MSNWLVSFRLFSSEVSTHCLITFASKDLTPHNSMLFSVPHVKIARPSGSELTSVTYIRKARPSSSVSASVPYVEVATRCLPTGAQWRTGDTGVYTGGGRTERDYLLQADHLKWPKHSLYHQEGYRIKAGSMKWRRPSGPPGQST